MKKWIKRIAIGVGGLFAALVIVLGIAWAVTNEPRPEGRRGRAAEALAERIESATDLAAWQRTGAVRWTFAGRHEHLWDRTRDVARVRWDDGTEALIRIGGPYGRAYRGGHELSGDEKRDVLESAWSYWVNDAFWLNPIAKFRDEGVSRAIVRLPEGGEGLLVSYSSGGLTPGDAYLWIPGDDGLPRAWRMWVSVIPVGGLEASWERWTTLATGAKISTLHRGPGGLDLEITDVEGAETLEALVGDDDPFAPLFEH